MNYFDTIEKSQVINDIVDVAKKLEEENEKDNIDEKNVTKLMFEQLMKGLYLQL